MKKITRTMLVAVAAIPAVAVVAGLVAAGVTVNWGPFAFLHSWEGEISAIEDRYGTDRDGEIVFYGASNFAQWTQLDDDFSEYRVQNHAFGGSTDRDLLHFADRLLYPYEPSIIVLQTGSNDYVGMTGTDQERIDAVIDQKQAMLEAFHVRLPDAQIVVMSGLLMPGRAEFTPVIRGINDRISDLAGELDYVTFVNAEALTWDGESYNKSMFVSDGIHLTHDARLRWADEYIRPALDAIIEQHGLHTIQP